MPGLVRVTGIEPVFQAWEAHVLPLNHTRRRLDRRRIGPNGSPIKAIPVT